ncbi:DUF4349 domain-containing protein [Lacrimispora sp. 210928-DFI.3.58]|uniref:DUF4349 domain-containing protein n=1 Tax=Lacrimispora sp. 210928-DFI.3.58 TaxID=2883214 RepID=UPI001D07673B|nr:DUF4349 domain-containing protein [Lacrimispora sp. 210928-DFI.3.58]MCB7320054.1 DUF4349 domain-containing protein [Lacrimispora sp. 210928-DFI.3.58]
MKGWKKMEEGAGTRRRTKIPQVRVWGTAFLLSALVLAGCGAGSSKSSVVAAETAAAAMGMPERGIYMAAMDAAPEEAAFEGEIPANDSLGDTKLSSESGSLQAVSTARKLIRNVSMDVETKEFETLVQSVTGKITELGGYVEQSEMSGSRLNYLGEAIPRYASITARIPSERLDSFVAEVEASGNVTSRSESTEDVTLQYSDVESRKKSLEIEQERIWALLEKADSLDSVIALEERLSEIRYELESLGSRLRLYDNQVEYSTVRLSISEVKDLTPAAPETTSARIQKGFEDNLEALSLMLTNALIGILTSAPFWLPLVLAALIVWRLVRRIKRKTGAKEKEKKLAGLPFRAKEMKEEEKKEDDK